MATRKKTVEPALTERELDKAVGILAVEAPEPKPGIVKEFTQNGLRYQRIRKEDGSTVDVRI
jgi:hypothetical protein